MQANYDGGQRRNRTLYYGQRKHGYMECTLPNGKTLNVEAPDHDTYDGACEDCEEYYRAFIHRDFCDADCPERNDDTYRCRGCKCNHCGRGQSDLATHIDGRYKDYTLQTDDKGTWIEVQNVWVYIQADEYLPLEMTGTEGITVSIYSVNHEWVGVDMPMGKMSAKYQDAQHWGEI